MVTILNKVDRNLLSMITQIKHL